MSVAAMMPCSRSPSSQVSQTLRTRDGHRVRYAVAGAADGLPVAVLHGGPGSGSQPGALRLFDLSRHRIVLIDQRGAGASKPRGSVRHNRTDALIADMEAIRVRLGIERWGVLGGSWGAALALAYAGRHPESLSGVVLRGLFLASEREVRGLFVTSRHRAPRQWTKLASAAHCTRPHALLRRCHALLQYGVSHARQRAVALAWRDYENVVLARSCGRGAVASATRTPRVTPARADRLVAKYRVQSHYLVHRCWLGETRLLALARRAGKAGVPIAAVHGSRDPVCPPQNLQRLARAVPHAQTECVPGAGHLASDPALHRRVARAIERLFAEPNREERTLRYAT